MIVKKAKETDKVVGVEPPIWGRARQEFQCFRLNLSPGTRTTWGQTIRVEFAPNDHRVCSVARVRLKKSLGHAKQETKFTARLAKALFFGDIFVGSRSAAFETQMRFGESSLHRVRLGGRIHVANSD